MSNNISESEWRTALTSIIEELDEQEYSKMLFSSCFDKMPKNVKTSTSREEMPQEIIQRYGVEGSISAVHEAMQQIPRNDPAVQDKLRPFVDRLNIKQEGDNRDSEWKSALTSILEQLDEQEYKKMLFCACFDKLPKGMKKSKSREEMPQTIIQHLGEGGSISAVHEAMLYIPRNDSAVQDKLRPFVDRLNIKQEGDNRGTKRKHEGDEDSADKKTKDSPCRGNLQVTQPAGGDVSAEKRLLSIRDQFIDRISGANVNKLLDRLLQHGFINDGEMKSIQIEKGDNKPRELIDMVRRKGNDASSRFITELCELDPTLSRELKLI